MHVKLKPAPYVGLKQIVVMHVYILSSSWIILPENGSMRLEFSDVIFFKGNDITNWNDWASEMIVWADTKP